MFSVDLEFSIFYITLRLSFWFWFFMTRILVLCLLNHWTIVQSILLKHKNTHLLSLISFSSCTKHNTYLHPLFFDSFRILFWYLRQSYSCHYTTILTTSFLPAVNGGCGIFCHQITFDLISISVHFSGDHSDAHPMTSNWSFLGHMIHVSIYIIWFISFYFHCLLSQLLRWQQFLNCLKFTQVASSERTNIPNTATHQTRSHQFEICKRGDYYPSTQRYCWSCLQFFAISNGSSWYSSIDMFELEVCRLHRSLQWQLTKTCLSISLFILAGIVLNF